MTTPGAPERPNLLLVTTDDLNHDAFGWLGSPLGATPYFDAFAETCTNFPYTHTAAPICQPSRSALMTGRVPHRNGALGFDPIDLSVPTLPEVLTEAGYFTAGLNKLPHMAPPSKFPWELVEQPSEVDAPASSSPRNPETYGRFVERAVQAAREADKPFFINVNIVDPHRPFYGTDRDRDAGGVPINDEFDEQEVVIPGFLEDLPDVRREVTRYYNSVRRCDRSFGRALAALDASGEAERTVVAFISDHGMAFPFAKTTLYSSGTCTPLMLRVPGVSGGAVNAEVMVSNTDVMPTLLELLGVAAPAGMDGASLVPLLEGRPGGRDAVFASVNTIFSGASYPSRCVRTKAHSYIWNAWSDGETRFRNESMSGLTFEALAAAAETDPAVRARVQHFLLRIPEEFYDLTRDPWERHNLIDDLEYKETVGALRARLFETMRATDDPLLPQFTVVPEA